MRALAALAVVVVTAGCFDPSPAEGLLCGPHDSCPGDQRCDRFAAIPVCRAPDSDAGVRPAPDFGPGGEPALIDIPAGGFEMGCNKAIRATCQDDEGPAHIVRLPAFKLTRTEITAGQYNACVVSGACRSPPSFDMTKASYPVTARTFQDARDYCSWARMRLPTEAEWEFAARGVSSYEFPWGHTPSPDCDRAVMMGCGGIGPVGALPAGASPEGVMDLAGNVAEWVNDWFGFDYYAYMPERNPPGPTSGRYKSLRGGSWKSRPIMLRTATRSGAPADQRSATVGFRCAKSASAAGAP